MITWYARTTVLAISIICCCDNAFAYKEETHENISKHAAMHVFGNSQLQQQLGLEYSIDDKRQQFPDYNGDPRNISDLIGFGARFEDSGTRALNHFFNPLTGYPLRIDSLGLNLGNATPDWALEDTRDITQSISDGTTIDAQSYSFKDARGYFLKALTTPDVSERKKNWGLTFQSLGQVMHLIHDMAQPQHVRTDMHLDMGSVKVGGTELDPLYNPSLYEMYTAHASLDRYYSSYMSGTDVMAQKFKVPRMFWMTDKDATATEATGTDGMGMAQYTNRGFFSAGTLNAVAFPRPTLGSVSFPSLADVCQQANPPCDAAMLTQFGTATLTFYANTVEDSLIPTQTAENPRAVTESIFDQALQKSNKPSVYALNRFNFDQSLSLLIPRATAYSAGLINYFFREKIEIAPPDAGVFSVIDHATSTGFTKFKVKLNNATPNDEAMGAGTLQLVLKFRRDTAYTNDLIGYPHIGSVAHDDELVISDPMPVPGGLSTAPQDFTFTLRSPLPLSATNLLLQVVFQGKLGDEEGAVAVSTKDVSEPTFVAYTNSTDYVHITSGFYTIQQIVDGKLFQQANPASCVFSVALTCYPPIHKHLSMSLGAGKAPASVVIDLDPSSFSRFVVIADQGLLPVVYDYGVGPSGSSLNTMRWDDSVSAVTFRSTRGVRAFDPLYDAWNGDQSDNTTWTQAELDMMSPITTTIVPVRIEGF